ncbi:MAG: AGE family epimerase/isomerase [Pseudomonadota bacterium]
MMDAAFPLWATAGVHPAIGFYERLTQTGAPIDDETTRVRLQARQTFCFAYAKHLGWEPGTCDRLIARGMDTLLSHCRRPDGLFGKQMAYAGGLADDTVDLYDNAFALLAFSWAHRAGHDTAGQAALDLSRLIDQHLERPSGEGGFREKLPALAIRLQNPHMHLFESSLALHEATGDARALERARSIEALLTQRFLQADTGALREEFALDWGPANGDRFEDGHQYEWVWLMAERARLDGAPISDASDALYTNALDLTGPDGALPLSHRLDRSVLNASERTWGLTEALKAHLARYEAGDNQAAARAAETFELMWARHVEPGPDGGWLDEYRADGSPRSEDMTAATGYHIFIACAELIRAAGA